MYNGTSVLDVHSHIRNTRATEIMLNRIAAGTGVAPIERPFAGGKSSDEPGLRDEDLQIAIKRHEDYLDARNIDVQILGPHPVDINGWMPYHMFTPWISYLNDLMFKTVQLAPGRWVGACQLPQKADAPDVSNCIPELERCVKEYGFVATYVTPDVTGRRDTPGMHQSYWYPLYEKCQELNIPIIVHATDGQDPRYAGIRGATFLAFYTEQFLTMHFLRHSDVFDRFPELKILICHCGGALDRFIPESPNVTPPDAKDRTNNMFFDTCVYDLEYLALLIKRRGLSQMCFGVEAPGSGATIRPETGKTSDDMVPLIGGDPAFDFLSEQDKLDIFHNNPIRFCPELADPRGANQQAGLAVVR